MMKVDNKSFDIGKIMSLIQIKKKIKYLKKERYLLDNHLERDLSSLIVKEIKCRIIVACAFSRTKHKRLKKIIIRLVLVICSEMTHLHIRV